MRGSLINPKNNHQILLLGIINDITKDFHIEGSINREAWTLSIFIHKYVEFGNTIISEGWAGYNFLIDSNSGYSHITHIHQGGSFGQGLIPASHIEVILVIIKSKIKSIYHVISRFHLMHFVREAQYRYRIWNKNENDKIKCHQIIFFLLISLILNSSISGNIMLFIFS